MFGVELRAAYHLTAELPRRSIYLAEAVAAAHAGVGRADAEGPRSSPPTGLTFSTCIFRRTTRRAHWEHAEDVARNFPVWVTKQPEAVLSAMALFIDVARGNFVGGRAADLA